MSTPAFEGWAILELMGHRKLAGRISEANIGGGAFIRIDVPGDGADVATQFYAPGAVYCITPTTEDIARRLAKGNRPAPVTRYELAEAAPTITRELAGLRPESELDDEDEFFTCTGCNTNHSIEDENETDDGEKLCDSCFEQLAKEERERLEREGKFYCTGCETEKPLSKRAKINGEVQPSTCGDCIPF